MSWFVSSSFRTLLPLAAGLLVSPMPQAASYFVCAFVGDCPPFKVEGSTWEHRYRCERPTIEPNFNAPIRRYRASGKCHIVAVDTNSTTFDNDKLISTITWTAEGSYDGNRHETSEVVNLSQENMDRKGFFATGQISSTRLCSQDPWLESRDAAACGPARVNRSGMIESQAASDYAATPIPISAQVTPEQRAALHAQLQRLQQALQSASTTARENPLAGPSHRRMLERAGAAAATQTAPTAAYGPVTLTQPPANARVVQGRMLLKANPPNGFQDLDNAGVMLEFTWLDTPADYKPRPYVNTYPIALKELLNGYSVPADVTRGQAGRWQVRVRINTPINGVWSAPLPLELAL